jgi:hypothetical protein
MTCRVKEADRKIADGAGRRGDSAGCVGGPDGVGGAAGYAIKRGTNATNVADGSYETTAMRGTVGP